MEITHRYTVTWKDQTPIAGIIREYSRTFGADRYAAERFQIMLQKRIDPEAVLRITPVYNSEKEVL